MRAFGNLGRPYLLLAESVAEWWKMTTPRSLEEIWINSPAPCRGIRGNHSTYPPPQQKKKNHLINSQNGQGSTSPCTVSKARLKSWNDTLVRCQGSSYPAIQVARPNDVNLSMSTTQGAFPVRLRPIRSMTSVTVRSAMISLTFCFWSIACTSCRTETELPTLRGCENRTTTAYKQFTQNSY